MLVRKHIELSRAAMLRALLSPTPTAHESLAAGAVAAWGLPCAVPALSVRSGFDAWLAERAWPEGDELVMSGANIPDMSRIAHHHKLRIRAVDFDLPALTPDVDAIATAITTRTRAIVVAQLFGARVDLLPIARLARERGLELVEDAAHAFAPDYRGHPEATMSMFSFGPIKRHTALGGAMLTVRDPELLARLRRRFDGQPPASGLAFRSRLAKYLLLSVLSRPWPLAVLHAGLVACGTDLDAVLHRSARNFAGRDLFAAIRCRPSRPLLRLLARRLGDLEQDAYEVRAARGAMLTERLRHLVEVADGGGVPHGHWVLPVFVDDPDGLVARARAVGLDATRRAGLGPIAGGLPRLEGAFARIVYLPFAPPHPPDIVERVVEVVRQHRSPGDGGGRSHPQHRTGVR